MCARQQKKAEEQRWFGKELALSRMALRIFADEIYHISRAAWRHPDVDNDGGAKLGAANCACCFSGVVGSVPCIGSGTRRPADDIAEFGMSNVIPLP
jgi:hypothetical protein